MLTTSVAVVRKMLEAVAGSAPRRCRVSGTSAPETPLTTHAPTIATQPPIFGVMAEFPDATSLVEAAKRTHAEGYRKTDAYTPYPIHELFDALARASAGRVVNVLSGSEVDAAAKAGLLRSCDERARAASDEVVLLNTGAGLIYPETVAVDVEPRAVGDRRRGSWGRSALVPGVGLNRMNQKGC